MPLARRRARTASPTSAAGARRPSGTPRIRASSAYGTGEPSRSRRSRKVTADRRTGSGRALNGWSGSRNRTRPRRSVTSSRGHPVVHAPEAIVSATSWPYAPTFWTGRRADPAGDAGQRLDPAPALVDRAGDERVPGSPARVDRAPAPLRVAPSTSTPVSATARRCPSNPRRRPPGCCRRRAQQRLAVPRRRAHRSTSSASTRASTTASAGPPSRSVVSSASGTSGRRAPDHRSVDGPWPAPSRAPLVAVVTAVRSMRDRPSSTDG